MPERPLHNMYYMAIVCPDAINEQVLQYKQWMQLHYDCKVALKSPAHITLVAPFYFAAEKEMELIHSLESFVCDILPVSIELNHFSHFGKRVIYINVVPGEALHRLSQSVNNYFRQLFPGVLKKDDRPFHPHITIANRDITPRVFTEAWEYFSRRKFEAAFTSDTISLLKLVDGKWIVIAKKEWR